MKKNILERESKINGDNHAIFRENEAKITLKTFKTQLYRRVPKPEQMTVYGIFSKLRLNYQEKCVFSPLPRDLTMVSLFITVHTFCAS